jgi:hypothetical protein
MSQRSFARRLSLGRANVRALALEPIGAGWGGVIFSGVIGIVALLVLLLSSTGGP